MPECKSIHKIIYANQPPTVRAPWNQFVSAIKAPGQQQNHFEYKKLRI